MVNEEKVKEFFKMAVYDKHEEVRYRQMGEYFRDDYVGKEMVKSVFSGSFAFLLVGALLLMGSIEAFLNGLNNVDWMQSVINIGIAYVLFMAVYLLITSVVYHVRYHYGRKKLKRYYGRLKKINRIYERETKLKA